MAAPPSITTESRSAELTSEYEVPEALFSRNTCPLPLGAVSAAS